MYLLINDSHCNKIIVLRTRLHKSPATQGRIDHFYAAPVALDRNAVFGYRSPARHERDDKAKGLPHAVTGNVSTKVRERARSHAELWRVVHDLNGSHSDLTAAIAKTYSDLRWCGKIHCSTPGPRRINQTLRWIEAAKLPPPTVNYCKPVSMRLRADVAADRTAAAASREIPAGRHRELCREYRYKIEQAAVRLYRGANIERADRISIATEGFLKSLPTHDPARGNVWTNALFHIKEAMKRAAIASNQGYRLKKRINESEDAFQKRRMELFDTFKPAPHDVSIDPNNEQSEAALSLIEDCDHGNPGENNRIIDAAIAVLDPREQRIYTARRLQSIPEARGALAAEFKISEERVRQIEAEAAAVFAAAAKRVDVPDDKRGLVEAVFRNRSRAFDLININRTYGVRWTGGNYLTLQVNDLLKAVAESIVYHWRKGKRDGALCRAVQSEFITFSPLQNRRMQPSDEQTPWPTGERAAEYLAQGAITLVSWSDYKHAIAAARSMVGSRMQEEVPGYIVARAKQCNEWPAVRPGPWWPEWPEKPSPCSATPRLARIRDAARNVKPCLQDMRVAA